MDAKKTRASLDGWKARVTSQWPEADFHEVPSRDGSDPAFVAVVPGTGICTVGCYWPDRHCGWFQVR